MRNNPHLTSLLLAALSVYALSACSTMPSTTKQESYQNFQTEFASTNVYSRSFPGSGVETCEAARRALLSQGYLIHEANASLVKGRKNFQPDSEVHLQIEFHVVCATNTKGSNTTTLFANAVRDRYSLKKSSNSASVGVGVLGSLSLPFGSTDDSLVRVASETIPARQFYDRFFELVEGYLDYAATTPVESSGSKDAPPTTKPEAEGEGGD
ncbi:MAG: hypothetical protein V7606_3226 [Burkholderiales bacterium]|jgi:hypothetical protein